MLVSSAAWAGRGVGITTKRSDPVRGCRTGSLPFTTTWRSVKSFGDEVILVQASTSDRSAGAAMGTLGATRIDEATLACAAVDWAGIDWRIKRARRRRALREVNGLAASGLAATMRSSRASRSLALEGATGGMAATVGV